MPQNSSSGLKILHYSAILLFSAAVLASEIWLMRVFAVGGWSHFGSTVIGIAMFGFGVSSVLLCVGRTHFLKHQEAWTLGTLISFAPLLLLANSFAQKIPFNPLFLVSNPQTKYYLLVYFLLYFLPFWAGALFLGLVFMRGQRQFGKVYFANMVGSGLGGLLLLAGTYYFAPSQLFQVSLGLWFLGALAWLSAEKRNKLFPILLLSLCTTIALGILFPQIVVSPYKGMSYAQRFPDSQKVYESQGPMGLMQVYSSSYFHFAPGLSDTAAFNLAKMPEKAFLGMYIDSDGPIGIMKDLPEAESDYLNYLPSSMPYLLKEKPEVLILQFGGGISTQLALKKDARHIVVAEGNPMMIEAIRDDRFLSQYTGGILKNPKVQLVEQDGRILIGHPPQSFDLIDLSLGDSTGLSMPGGFSIHENYLYTKETLLAAMQALKPDGLLAVTIWNKEDPPKSTLRVMATMVDAGRSINPEAVSGHFFIAHTYLSTLTILYQKTPFSAEQLQELQDFCHKMSFEVVYNPQQAFESQDRDAVFQAYRDIYFNTGQNQDAPDGGPALNLSMGHLYSIFIQGLFKGDFEKIRQSYVFEISPLSNDHPYLAGFIKLKDIPHFFTQLESVSDEWGYLLLWASLGVSLLLGTVLLLIPLISGKRGLAKQPGKFATVVFFICLGLAYIFVELVLMSKYLMVLSNPTISISLLIGTMLFFSGLGSLVSEKVLNSPRKAMVIAGLAIFVLLTLNILFLDSILNSIGAFSYLKRVLICLGLLAPLAFAMGFPFSLGMSTLARTGRESLFVWAWGINGSFSVVASMLVPLLTVNLGLHAVMWASAFIYLLSTGAFLSLSRGSRTVIDAGNFSKTAS